MAYRMIDHKLVFKRIGTASQYDNGQGTNMNEVGIMGFRAPANSPVPQIPGSPRLVQGFTDRKPSRPRAAHPRNRTRSNINERSNEPRPKAAHPRNRPVLRRRMCRPKAAHHLNHPMFIPNRDEDSDEEVETLSTASSQLIRELIRPRLTFVPGTLFVDLN